MIARSIQSLRRTFARDGYIIGPRIFGADDVATLRAACLNVLSGSRPLPPSPYFLIDGSQPAGGLRRAFNASFVDHVVRSAVHNSEIARLASGLLGGVAVRLWYSQIIEKPRPPELPGITATANVGWHQDYNYWQCCERPDMLTAWIALQDTTNHNGAMRLVKGSHNWGLVPANQGFNTRDLDSFRNTLQSGITHTWQEVECGLTSGQVSFHHCLTFHASGPNLTETPRLGLAVHMMVAGMRRQHQASCHRSLTFLEPLPKAGEVFSGEQWPVTIAAESVTSDDSV